MKRSTATALSTIGFIAGCQTAPATVEVAPVYTLAAAEIYGPDFWRIRYYSTAAECETAAATEKVTDAALFCIQEGTN